LLRIALETLNAAWWESCVKIGLYLENLARKIPKPQTAPTNQTAIPTKAINRSRKTDWIENDAELAKSQKM
jgi:hypothetical protein